MPTTSRRWSDWNSLWGYRHGGRPPLFLGEIAVLVSTQRQISFAVLNPVFAPARSERLSIREEPTTKDVDAFLSRHPLGDVMAIDLETRGGDPAIAGSLVVGLALSNTTGTIYLHVSGYEDVYHHVLDRLYQLDIPLIAHNQFFDGSWMYRDSGNWHNWRHCTYALYKLLATEGYIGQRWGLKNAQVDLLGWEETNERDLSQWLVDNGYGNRIIDGKSGEEVLRPDKGEMWRAPAAILGKYCALDADSTYLLYTRVLLPALNKFKALQSYAGEIYQQYLRVLIAQKFSGILIDRERLSAHDRHLEQSAAHLSVDFQLHKDVAPHIRAWNQLVVEEHRAKEPARYLLKKMGKEPAQHKKDGSVSSNWIKWRAKADAPPVESKNWWKWFERLSELEAQQHFNINSNDQKRWLFYERLGNPILLTTDSGQPATDEKALRSFGEPGRILIEQNELVKEKSYVEAVLSHSTTGVLHPSFRVPGTYTGRLAGAGGVNIQQMPKSREFLSCWQARPGMKWVQLDFTALEQVVLAELSKDPALWKLYGPTARPNDVYLFTGANLPVIGEAIRAAGYDPDRPTPEGIAAAKRQAKKERGIAKVITLASSYGAGAGKIQQTLQLEGIPISLNDCKTIHQGYWRLYAGVKLYERELIRQYENNDGWVLNGIGRPLGIDHDKEKDIVNRVVQSTGHDILVIWLSIYSMLLDTAGIQWTPIIADLHDESIIEVPEEQAAEALRIMSVDAMQALNDMLKGRIRLKGEGQIANCFADIKIE